MTGPELSTCTVPAMPTSTLNICYSILTATLLFSRELWPKSALFLVFNALLVTDTGTGTDRYGHRHRHRQDRHRHRDIQAERDIGTDTGTDRHRHWHRQTQRYSHKHTQSHRQRETQRYKHRHTQSHRHRQTQTMLTLLHGHHSTKHCYNSPNHDLTLVQTKAAVSHHTELVTTLFLPQISQCAGKHERPVTSL